MKRLYDYITKANQVLLFLVIIGGAGWISYLVYQEASRKFEPPHVSVAQTPDEMSRSVVDDVRFLGQSSEVYIFGIVKRVVMPDEERRRKIGLVDYLGEYHEPGEIVNVVFVKGDKPVKTLLPNDGLVLSHYVSGQYRSEKLKPLLPDVILKGVLDFQITSPGRLVVKTGPSSALQFWEIDVDAQTKKEMLGHQRDRSVVRSVEPS